MWEASGPRDVLLSAAGSHPGDLHKLWRTRTPNGYHMEYGYSCMSYEIPGAMGAKLADPTREVYVFLGDGTYLMMPTEIVTSVQEGIKIIIVLVDNHGFASIGGLSRSLGQGGFGTSYRFRSKESGQLDGECLTVDLCCQRAQPGRARLEGGQPGGTERSAGESQDPGPHDRHRGGDRPLGGSAGLRILVGCGGGRGLGNRERAGGAGPVRNRPQEANAIISESAKREQSMIERLPNFIDGSWRTSARQQALNVLNPASAQVLAQVPLSPAAEVHQAAETAARAFTGWRRTPAGERVQPLFKLKTLLEAESRRPGAHHHERVRQDSRGEHRRDAARHRERGDSLRHPDADAGLQQRGHRRRHRRAHDPPAAGSGRGHHALQLPGHDPVLVSAVRGGRRELLHPEAFRARADDFLEALSPDGGRGLPARRGPTGERRPRGGGRHPRSSRDPRGELCRLHGHGALHLQPRGGQRQTRAVPGRRQESRGGDAGRRHGNDHADPGRFRVRLRRAALPGRLGGDHGGRRPPGLDGADGGSRPQAQGGLRVGTAAWRWAR